MWVHPYALTALDFLNAKSESKLRYGFFVKKESTVADTDALKTFLNFSEFIHWPELGDPNWSELKPFLIKTSETDFKFPFTLAPNDLVSVKSNALVSGDSKNWGLELEKLQESKFEVLKFKMGRDFKTEYTHLMKLNLSSYLVRIDFNNAFNFKDAQEALAMLKKIPNLEYAEDPMNYGDYHWSELQKIVPLALDQCPAATSADANTPKNFQYRIVKPIRGFSLAQLTQWTYEKKKIVLTNMMDSTVGTWKTYLYYCELKKHLPYHLCTPGFYTHHLYANYPHSQWLGFKGAEWSYDSEKLIQLNSALEKLSWNEFHYTDPTSLDRLFPQPEIKP